MKIKSRISASCSLIHVVYLGSCHYSVNKIFFFIFDTIKELCVFCIALLNFSFAGARAQTQGLAKVGQGLCRGVKPLAVKIYILKDKKSKSCAKI